MFLRFFQKDNNNVWAGWLVLIKWYQRKSATITKEWKPLETFETI